MQVLQGGGGGGRDRYIDELLEIMINYQMNLKFLWGLVCWLTTFVKDPGMIEVFMGLDQEVLVLD